eukprot:1149023-Pyramimonas_sp.AAC.1
MLAEDELIANPAQVGKALCTELMFWSGNKRFQMASLPGASNAMTSRCVYKSNSAKHDNDEMARAVRPAKTRPAPIHGRRSRLIRNGQKAKPAPIG